MSGEVFRVSAAGNVQALVVELEPISPVFCDILFAKRDAALKLQRDLLFRTGSRPVRDFNLIGHSSSFRGGFARPTMAEAGAVSSRLGGGLAA